MTLAPNLYFDRLADLTTLSQLETIAEVFGNQVALLDTTQPTAPQTTHAELLTRAKALASQMVDITAGHGRERPRIVLVLPNGTELALTLLAVTLIGEAAPLNFRLTLAEYASEYNLLRADAVILGTGSPAQAETAAAAAGITIVRLDHQKSSDITKLPNPPHPDDIALVLLTSGSTGKAKIVPLSHRNICASARDVARSIALGPTDRALVMWEQFHIGGLVDLLLAPLGAGGSVAITQGFDTDKFFSLLEQTQSTWFQGVPTTLGELVRHGKEIGFDGKSSLRLVRAVAAALTPEGQDALEMLFRAPVIRTLGMTEAGPLITSTALPPAPQKPGSVGQPAGPEVCILNPNGDPMGAGQDGEVVVRGENVFAGYESADDTVAAFVNGWFLTGDVGHFDADGDLFLTGRKKDMINRGGEKISPAEVDAALLAVPGVHEAACFEMPHSTLGEDITAAIVADPEIEIDSLKHALSERLAAHKIPARIFVRDALPKTPVGKIDRSALTKAFSQSSTVAAEGAAPEGPLEIFLAQIWGKELGKPVLDREADFASFDGDSLSAVRVVAAVEQALDTTLPDAVFDHVTSLTEMAKFLAHQGVSFDETQAETFDAKALAQAPVLMGFEPDYEATICEGIAVCKTPSMLHKRLQELERFHTLEDLRGMVRRLRMQRVVGSKDPISTLRGWFSREMLRLRVPVWRRRLDAEAKLTSDVWQRQPFAPTGILYSSEQMPTSYKTLLVGFTGNAFQLGLPVRWFLAGLDPSEFDLAVVVDPARCLFEHGAPGLGSDLISLAKGIEQSLPTTEYARVVAFGNSGGVPAGIIAAIENGWDRSVSSAPARLSDHPELERQFDDALSKLSDRSVGRVFLCARGTRRKEVEAFKELQRRLDTMQLHEEPVEEKNIIYSAHQAGTLGKLIRTVTGQQANLGSEFSN